MGKSIVDALRQYVDEQEHSEYVNRACALVEKYRGQPFTMRVLAAIQCDLDFEHRQCCISAGRRLRRLTASVGTDSGTLLLTMEPYDPATHGRKETT